MPTYEAGKNLPVNNTAQSKHGWTLMLFYTKTHTTANSTVVTAVPIYSELESTHFSQCIAITVTLLHIICKDGAGCLPLAQWHMSHLTNTVLIACQSFVTQASWMTSALHLLSQKIMPLYMLVQSTVANLLLQWTVNTPRNQILQFSG